MQFLMLEMGKYQMQQYGATDLNSYAVRVDETTGDISVNPDSKT
jgi:hypothetical protein